MHASTRRSLQVGIAAALGILLLLVLWRLPSPKVPLGIDPTDAPVEEGVAARRDPPSTNARDQEVSSGSAELSPTRSVKELLEDYWGKPVAQLDSVYDLAQLTPEALDAPGRLAPWDDVEPFARDILTSFRDSDAESFVAHALRWGTWRPGTDYMNLKVNPQGKQLSQHDRETLDRISEEWNARIEPIAQKAAQEIRGALVDAIDRGLFERAPFFFPKSSGLPDPAASRTPGERGSFRRSTATFVEGWAIRFDFDSRNHPELHRLWLALGELKEARAAAVRRYIDALP